MTRPRRRLLDSPWLELAVGLVLLAAGLLELRAIILVQLPNKGPMLPHAAATVGLALVLRSLPGVFLGLELADKAVQGLPVRPALAWLDDLAHSHAADIAMGVILMASGAADLADLVFSGRALGLLNTASGAALFGLAPLVNAFLALYKGAARLDREHPRLVPARLLDRAVRNPWVQSAAGGLLLAGGLSDLWAAWSGHSLPARMAGLPDALALLGLFSLLSGLPGVYLGLKALLPTRPRAS